LSQRQKKKKTHQDYTTVPQVPVYQIWPSQEMAGWLRSVTAVEESLGAVALQETCPQGQGIQVLHHLSLKTKYVHSIFNSKHLFIIISASGDRQNLQDSDNK
jgi:hypothetical protein